MLKIKRKKTHEDKSKPLPVFFIKYFCTNNIPLRQHSATYFIKTNKNNHKKSPNTKSQPTNLYH